MLILYVYIIIISIITIIMYDYYLLVFIIILITTIMCIYIYILYNYTYYVRWDNCNRMEHKKVEQKRQNMCLIGVTKASVQVVGDQDGVQTLTEISRWRSDAVCA